MDTADSTVVILIAIDVHKGYQNWYLLDQEMADMDKNDMLDGTGNGLMGVMHVSNDAQVIMMPGWCHQTGHCGSGKQGDDQLEGMHAVQL